MKIGLPSGSPRVSFVIATHNRRDVLLHTLAHVGACGLATREFETIVVDNASADGTADAVADRFPRVRLVRRGTNEGPCAKNVGVNAARGEFVVFLDDDSFPQPGSVRRMIEHFRFEPQLGAAVFTVTLPDGSRECSAYPDVCIGCGTGFRVAALREVGGLPDDFFMAAEEYDLSLRLLEGGWRVRTFPDIGVTHLKTPGARFPARIARLDARNNVLLAMRHFPEPWRARFAMAWLERYRLMAHVNGTRGAFWLGAVQGVAGGIGLEYRPVGPEAFEQFAKIHETTRRLDRVVRRTGMRKVLFVDVGKNFVAYQEAAKACGVEVVGVADARLGGRGYSYQGVRVLSDAEATRLEFDAAVVSNLNPVQAAGRTAQWRDRQPWPVFDLFEPLRATKALAVAA